MLEVNTFTDKCSFLSPTIMKFLFLDPDKIGQLLSDSIFEAHQRTCLLSRDQIQVGCSQGVSSFKVEQFKKMVSTSSS